MGKTENLLIFFRFNHACVFVFLVQLVIRTPVHYSSQNTDLLIKKFESS